MIQMDQTQPWATMCEYLARLYSTDQRIDIPWEQIKVHRVPHKQH